LKRYKKWEKISRKKIEYISEKYIKTVFLMSFKNHIRHMDTLQQQSPDVQRSNPWWVLKTVVRNLPNETCPTSLPPLQPAQWPLEMWEIFMPHPQNGCFHNTLQQAPMFSGPTHDGYWKR
jgi:hypothetical protein